MIYDQLKLDNQLCFRFYTVSRLIIQHYQPLLNKLGITYPQYLVLMVLWEHDEMPVNDIARKLVLETNTVTPLLQRMEKQKILIRKHDKEDRRKVLVSLTPHGLDLQEQAKDIPCAMAGIMSEDLQKVFADNHEKIRDVLDKMIEDMKR